MNRRRTNLFLLIGREDRNLFVGDIGPLDKLLAPLHDGYPTLRVVSLAGETRECSLRAHEDVQRTRHDFLIVHAAVIPTSVLPAPQGRTIIPDRARLHTRKLLNGDTVLRTHPFPNILLRLVSWYGRMTVEGLRSISRLALTVSLRKSYSSSMGYSNSLQRFLTSCGVP